VPSAGAKDVAVVRSFPVTLGSDGILTILFVATEDEATLSGLEVLLPAVLRINAGCDTNFTDALDNLWLADFSYIGGPIMLGLIVGHVYIMPDRQEPLVWLDMGGSLACRKSLFRLMQVVHSVS
jgi:hypothetical protein